MAEHAQIRVEEKRSIGRARGRTAIEHPPGRLRMFLTQPRANLSLSNITEHASQLERIVTYLVGITMPLSLSA